MHTELLKKATHEQLKSFLFEQFDRLKETMPELYKEMECELYEAINGEHFDEKMFEIATSKFKNADGSTGAHWTLEQVRDYLKQRGIEFKGYTTCDVAYVMNMMYSDYYGSVPEGIESIVRLTKAFLEDPDAPDGKAYRYYKAMKH